MIRSLLPGLLLAASLPLSAATFHEMDTTEIKTCTFSSRYHNRIVVSDGAIKKIICPEGHLSISMEEESGQAFVQATRGTPNPAMLSVITSQGTVQDLQINFEDKPTEVIILSEPSFNEESSAPAGTEDPKLSRLSHTITQILRCGCPEGFRWKPSYGYPCKLKSGICVSPGYKLTSPDIEIHVFRLHNPTKRSKAVKPHELSISRGEWVYIENPCLKPGQCTRAVVGMRGECL